MGQTVGVIGDGLLPGILREIARCALPPGRARFRHIRTAEGLEQRGLTRPVAPHQSDLVAGPDLEGDAVDDGLATDLDDEVVDDQHPTSQPPFLRCADRLDLRRVRV